MIQESIFNITVLKNIINTKIKRLTFSFLSNRACSVSRTGVHPGVPEAGTPTIRGRGGVELRIIAAVTSVAGLRLVILVSVTLTWKKPKLNSVEWPKFKRLFLKYQPSDNNLTDSNNFQSKKTKGINPKQSRNQH